MPGARWWRAGAAALPLLLLTACEHTPEDQARRVLIETARRRNAAVGAAVAVLLLAAGRLLAHVVAGDRRRWPPRPARLPALLLATMVASQVTAFGLVAFVGGGVGYLGGPTPEPTAPQDIGMPLWGLVLAPFGLFAVVGALAFLATVARVPNVGTETFGIAAFGHVLAAVPGVVFGVYSTPAEWAAGGWLLAGVSLAGAAGYGYGIAVRVRTAREMRARWSAGRLPPPR